MNNYHEQRKLDLINSAKELAKESGNVVYVYWFGYEWHMTTHLDMIKQWYPSALPTIIECKA